MGFLFLKMMYSGTRESQMVNSFKQISFALLFKRFYVAGKDYLCSEEEAVMGTDSSIRSLLYLSVVMQSINHIKGRTSLVNSVSITRTVFVLF